MDKIADLNVSFISTSMPLSRENFLDGRNLLIGS